jgi:predicted phage terminase large subunit-like protein
VVLSIDTAQKTTADSAWTVIQAWGFVGPAAYLLTQRRGRWGLPQIVGEARGLIALLGRVDATLVELQSNGAAVVAELGRHVAGVLGISIDGGSPGKVARLKSCSPRWQAGNVFIADGGERSPLDEAANDWVAGYVEELLAFPGCDWSDQVDSSSMALQYRSEHDGGFFAAAC